MSFAGAAINSNGFTINGFTINGEGLGKPDLTISGNDASRIFNADADLTLADLRFLDGNSGSINGGALRAAGGRHRLRQPVRLHALRLGKRLVIRRRW